MNILFLYLRHSENPMTSMLAKDISDKFYKQGHSIKVVMVLEKNKI
ncbi:MAG: hypothetical protein ACRDA0_07955 [Cetobacterium sp.]